MASLWWLFIFRRRAVMLPSFVFDLDHINVCSHPSSQLRLISSRHNVDTVYDICIGFKVLAVGRPLIRHKNFWECCQKIQPQISIILLSWDFGCMSWANNIEQTNTKLTSFASDISVEVAVNCKRHLRIHSMIITPVAPLYSTDTMHRIYSFIMNDPDNLLSIRISIMFHSKTV